MSTGELIGLCAASLRGLATVSHQIMVVVRLKKAWRGLGDWAESPSSDVLDRTAYARYGSAASANMFCRALSNKIV